MKKIKDLFDKKISRRDFIKVSLGSSTAAAVGLSTLNSKALAAGTADAVAKSIGVDKWVKGACRFCGTGCGVYVGTKAGKVVAIKGNPNAKTNFGYLCPKGLAGFKSMYHADRLKAPMIRQADGKFKEVSWDEAIKTVGDKIKYFHDKYGKDSVAYYGSGQCTTEESYTFNKLWKAGFRSNQVEGNPRLCMASAVAGYISTFGADEPSGAYADIEQSKCIFLIGSNAAECHPILFARILKVKRSNPDFKLIVCDPRKTKTGDAADIYMPMKPNTDLSILNAMAYVIINEKLHNQDFIDKHAAFSDGTNPVKFDDYVKFLADYEPSKVEAVTGVKADMIIEAARTFAKSPATMSMFTMGLNQRVNGTALNNQVHNLHLITGQIGRPGADSFSLTGQPNACGGVRETGSLSHLLPGTRLIANDAHRAAVEKSWGLAAGTIDPKPGLHTMAMFSALGAEADAAKTVKMMITSTTNPAQSLPNVNKYLKGMEDSFLVTIDIFPTRTTQLADVILPAAFVYEKGGVFGCSERRSQLTEKAVEPIGQAKPDLWIAAQLAKHLGLDKLIPWNGNDSMKANEQAWNDYITCTKDTEHTLFGAKYDRLRKSEEGVQWPCPDEKHPGTYKRYVKQYDPMFAKMQAEGKIPADAGDIFFYGKPNGKAVVFLRGQKPAGEAPTKDYPFTLTTGRVVEQWHTGTMTSRVRRLSINHPQSVLEINPNDAQKLNLKDGDMARVFNGRGEITVGVKVTTQSNEGSVFVTMHDQAIARMVNFVTLDAVDAASKQPEFKISAVNIEKASGSYMPSAPYLISDVNAKA